MCWGLWRFECEEVGCAEAAAPRHAGGRNIGVVIAYRLESGAGKADAPRRTAVGRPMLMPAAARRDGALEAEAGRAAVVGVAGVLLMVVEEQHNPSA